MKMAELSYEIELLYIEGFSPKTISIILECPIDLVYDWLEEQSVEAADDQDAESAYF